MTKEERETLILENRPLVLWMANKYKDAAKSLSKDDLISVGVLGLIEAVDRYDNREGANFRHLAATIIRQNIVREIANNGGIIALGDKMNKVRCGCTAFFKNGEIPNRNQLQSIAEKAGVLFENALLAYATFIPNIISIEDSTGEDGGKLLFGEVVRNGKTLSPESEAEKKELLGFLMREIEKLTSVEYFVIVRMLGIGGVPIVTAKDLGITLNLTACRVSQIKTEALKKLKRRCEKYVEERLYLIGV